MALLKYGLSHCSLVNPVRLQPRIPTPRHRVQRLGLPRVRPAQAQRLGRLRQQEPLGRRAAPEQPVVPQVRLMATNQLGVKHEFTK